MAFVGSICGCRAAFSFPSPLRFRLPLVRTSCVLSLGLSNLSFSSSSSSIIKTGCAPSGPLLPFLRQLTERRQKQRPRRSREDMFLFQHPRARKRATFVVLTTMMMAWGFMIITSKFTSQSTAKAIKSTEMEGSASTVPSIVVYVTVPSKEAGKKLAESIVGEKLAACVNRVPGIESVYFWDGKVQTDSEELLIIKTRESLLEALTEHVKANHEYDVPEVISMPITGGNVKYLEWIKNSTRE